MSRVELLEPLTHRPLGTDRKRSGSLRARLAGSNRAILVGSNAPLPVESIHSAPQQCGQMRPKLLLVHLAIVTLAVVALIGLRSAYLEAT